MKRGYRNRVSCVTCHGSPTTYAYQSAFAVIFDEDGKPLPNTLAATTVSEVEQAAVRWKRGRPGWAALRKLMPE